MKRTKTTVRSGWNAIPVWQQYLHSPHLQFLIHFCRHLMVTRFCACSQHRTQQGHKGYQCHSTDFCCFLPLALPIDNTQQDITWASYPGRKTTTEQLGNTVLVRLEMSISFLNLWLLQRYGGGLSWLWISRSNSVLLCRTVCFVLWRMKAWENHNAKMLLSQNSRRRGLGALLYQSGPPDTVRPFREVTLRECLPQLIFPSAV